MFLLDIKNACGEEVDQIVFMRSAASIMELLRAVSFGAGGIVLETAVVGFSVLRSWECTGVKLGECV